MDGEMDSGGEKGLSARVSRSRVHICNGRFETGSVNAHRKQMDSVGKGGLSAAVSANWCGLQWWIGDGKRLCSR